jgi:hypothetical protein
MRKGGWDVQLGELAAGTAIELDGTVCQPTSGIGPRIASPEMLPDAEMLPHLICSRPILIGGANDEADQHGDA